MTLPEVQAGRAWLPFIQIPIPHEPLHSGDEARHQHPSTPCGVKREADPSAKGTTWVAVKA